MWGSWDLFPPKRFINRVELQNYDCGALKIMDSWGPAMLSRQNPWGQKHLLHVIRIQISLLPILHWELLWILFLSFPYLCTSYINFDMWFAISKWWVATWVHIYTHTNTYSETLRNVCVLKLWEVTESQRAK